MMPLLCRLARRRNPNAREHALGEVWHHGLPDASARDEIRRDEAVSTWHEAPGAANGAHRRFVEGAFSRAEREPIGAAKARRKETGRHDAVPTGEMLV